MAMSVLKVNDIYAGYGSSLVVDGVSWRVLSVVYFLLKSALWVS